MTEKEIQPKTETRSQFKKRKKSEERKTENREKIRIRLIPIWLRIILVLCAIVISVLSGIIVGYGVIGDGKPMDALSKSTWTHIVDLVNKK
ncbi:DNA-directed RNA polymerase subunit beta [Bacillus sp. FJAT-49736]|uniref:DNA-directed RNA polymerase subunit beta n=1 Tax=Bacillus sp. FJAT-49736 TaxID=2833582 RepID=UPI001BC90A77|nr:DNA-directed RNA polymerase subunit beta [Bacillus sp. FJAT-49736]MBS4175442.1 DNA-directed RNA polymerase subunit beta [Bacillus sp. FJAT-49736]